MWEKKRISGHTGILEIRASDNTGILEIRTRKINHENIPQKKQLQW